MRTLLPQVPRLAALARKRLLPPLRWQPPATASALRRFLRWTISPTGGNDEKYLTRVNFIPLPDFIRGLSEAQIDQIK